MEVQNLAGLGITQARQGTPTPPKFDATNVNDQLSSTLNQGGLLMRMAQSKGQGLASQRGLGNSTIGIDAAQRAMVDAALPIAQQNAQQAQQLTMQGNDFTNQGKLNDQQAQLQERRDQLLHQQQLGTLDKQSQLELKQLDAQLKSQMTLNNQQNQWNSAESQKDRQQQLTVLEKQFGQETAQMAQQVVANTHGMYMGAIDSAMGSYNERYAAAMADTTMKAADKQTLINNMKKELNSTLGMYQQLYSNISTIRPDWSKFPTTQLPGVKIS
jgi:hypothetical protein